MKGKEINELYRTFSPKYTHYNPDGCGRDSFIILNNGGLQRGDVKSLKIAGNLGITKKMDYHSLKRNVAPFKYRSDGSGRDSYVLFEHAGLERDVKSLSSFHLKDILRKYEPSPSSTRYDAFKPVWMNKKELNQIKLMNKIQSNVINRLYYNEKNKFCSSTNFKLPSINTKSAQGDLSNKHKRDTNLKNLNN